MSHELGDRPNSADNESLLGNEGRRCAFAGAGGKEIARGAHRRPSSSTPSTIHNLGRLRDYSIGKESGDDRGPQATPDTKRVLGGSWSDGR